MPTAHIKLFENYHRVTHVSRQPVGDAARVHGGTSADFPWPLRAIQTLSIDLGIAFIAADLTPKSICSGCAERL